MPSAKHVMPTAVMAGDPRSLKRRRDADNAAQRRENREEAAVALEVDIMILDYQAYRTTHALLETPAAIHDVSNAVRNQLVMTDALVKSFKGRHSSHRADNALLIRLLLLQFCTLSTRRFTDNDSTPSMAELEALRAASGVRVRRWIHSRDRVPSIDYDASFLEEMPCLDTAQLIRNRAHVLTSLGINNTEHTHYGSLESVSLLDILPIFMQICALAHQTRRPINITSTMRLMTDFMLQASLEQYLIYGRHNTVDPIDEAFAWGCFADAGSESEDVENSEEHTFDGDEVLAEDEEDVEMTDTTEAGKLGSVHTTTRAKSLHNHKGLSSSLDHGQQHSASVNGSQSNVDILSGAHDDDGAFTKHGNLMSDGDGDSRRISPNGKPICMNGSNALSEMERAIDAMFRDETGEQNSTWTNAKIFALDQLLRSSDPSLPACQHLQELATSYPVAEFDQSLRHFLRQCTKLIDLPTLVQIERGQLSGMSKQETKDFLMSCGLTSSGHLR